jgi:4-amino-4-deoxychorismate lyase
MSASAALYNGGPPGPEIAWARGLHYGDGVFRTLLIWQGEVVDLERQLAHLAADAAPLGLDPPPRLLLRAEAAALAAGAERAVLKILLWRAGAARGYAPHGARCERLLLCMPARSYPAACWEQGVRLADSGLRLGDQPRLAGIKHLNRLEQVLASGAIPEDAEEAFVCDARGNPVSGTRTNLFTVRGAVLSTAVLDHCGIRGMMRSKIIERAARLGLGLQLGTQELTGVDEVFLCNSLIGIWPVRAVDGMALAAPGPLTRRLMDALQHPRLC